MSRRRWNKQNVGFGFYLIGAVGIGALGKIAAILSALGNLGTHITNIFSKLQVADRAQAIVRARDAGLGVK